MRGTINTIAYVGGYRSAQLTIESPLDSREFQADRWAILSVRRLRPWKATLYRAQNDDYATGVFEANNPARKLAGRTAGHRGTLEFFLHFKVQDDRGAIAKFSVRAKHALSRRARTIRAKATVPADAAAHEHS